MRLCFFSDVHGVPRALERFLARADELRPDRLVFLGDALYHGPRNGVPGFYDPVEVARLLNGRKDKIIAVRGNCDSEVDQMLLEFPILGDYAEILTENRRFFATHGHLWNANRLPPIPSGGVLVHGHTHIPELRTLENGIVVFNPGSISLPKGGSAASFGFYDGQELSILPLD